MNQIKKTDSRIRSLKAPAADVWNIVYNVKNNDIGQWFLDKSSPVIVDICNYHGSLDCCFTHGHYFITEMIFLKDDKLIVDHNELNVPQSIVALAAFQELNIKYFYVNKLLDDLNKSLIKDKRANNILQEANQRINRYNILSSKYNLCFKFTTKAEAYLQSFYEYMIIKFKKDLYSEEADTRYTQRFTTEFAINRIISSQNSACKEYVNALVCTDNGHKFFHADKLELCDMKDFDIFTKEFVEKLKAVKNLKEEYDVLNKRYYRKYVILNKTFNKYVKSFINGGKKLKNVMNTDAVVAFMLSKNEKTLDIHEHIKQKLIDEISK